MEVYQEQLALAIPRLSAELCELVSPSLALSQLCNDPLRRAFLDRCAEVGAGQPITDIVNNEHTQAMPDIPSYHEETAKRRRRLKHLRNIYVIEASVRKEHFSFFTSLPEKVRTHLDSLHADALKLPREEITPFARQVAEVLNQLGVDCELSKPCGPLGLHVVAKATNSRADCKEMVYECNDVDSYYSDPQAAKDGAPVLTAPTKLRHKLLPRMGVKLTHVNVWEWRQMSDAHRVNFMVKLQSLQ